MQINRIECRLGATVNAGDFQSVKAEVMASADLDRNEEPMAAYAALATFVREALVNGMQNAHPDAVRKMLTADARLEEAANGGTKTVAAPAEKKKPGPKPKEKTATEAELKDSIPETGGGTSTGGNELDELDDLLNDGPAEVVTKEQVHEALVKLNKKGGKGAVLELLKKYGVANLSQLPETKFAEAKATAEDMASKIG